MIGQAGTGSPEAGVELRVDSRVLVYTLWTGDETRRPGGGGPLRDHLTTSTRGHFLIFYFYFLFCMVAEQVSDCWESDPLAYV